MRDFLALVVKCLRPVYNTFAAGPVPICETCFLFFQDQKKHRVCADMFCRNYSINSRLAPKVARGAFNL